MQNVSPSLLIGFLREHRSEWADFDIDANVATSFRSNGNSYARGGGVSHVQLPLPLAHSGEHGEVLYLGTCLVGVQGVVGRFKDGLVLGRLSYVGYWF